MTIRWQSAIAAGLAVWFGASAVAAENKKKQPATSRASVESNATPNITTNETKPKVDLAVYKLSPTDVIEITVYRQEDLTTKRRIAKDGTIAFPLLGVINIGGRTVEQAGNQIKELLAKDYLVNPQVSVTVIEYAKKWFHVVGQVYKQGSYPIPEEETMDLMRAIATAGGFTQIAARSKVTVTRMNGEKKEIIPVDVKAREKDKNAKPFPILPDDTITVPESIF
jgi:polysaccharide export outer membrane protein